MGLGRRALAVLPACGLLVAGAVTVVVARADAQPPKPVCAAGPPGHRLPPVAGRLDLGEVIDWDHDTPQAQRSRLGVTPAVYSLAQSVPLSDAAIGYADRAVDEIAATGASLMLTLDPDQGLAAVDGRSVDVVANRLRAWGEQGVRVYVRFAPEMNGPWNPWGMDPAAFTRTFRQLAAAVHDRAPLAAMVWAPNNGGGYPYPGETFSPAAGSARATALDTNHDGQLDRGDDPYAPYWPGDDAVDWVGLSLYHFGNTYPWGADVVAEGDKFVQEIRGTYDGDNGDERAVPDFYAEYAVAHRKPFAITETGAYFDPLVHGAAELPVKESWWRQVFSPSVATELPDLAMVVFFDLDKLETEEHAVVHWNVDGTPAVAQAFRAALPARTGFAPQPCGSAA